MSLIPPIIHKSWHENLQPLFDDPKMELLKNRILLECSFFPKGQDIFRVFSMPLDKIRIVILGQDPYPTPGQATGLAFSVSHLTKMPKSLTTIKAEVDRLTPTTVTDIKNWKTLSHWHDQGVFLLNTALTVEQASPGSHIGYWEWFTKQVIQVIAYNNPCIWMLWGSKAIGFRYLAIGEVGELIDNDPKNIPMSYTTPMNIILEAPHPAAESYGNKKKFSGCNHFKIANQILSYQGKTIINW